MVAISNQLTPNPASGTLLADGTEQTLAFSTGVVAGGLLSLVVDASPMLAGDAVELRIYSNAGTANDRQAYFTSFANEQNDTLKISIPIALEAGARFKATLKQTTGTNRSFPWKVLQL